MSAIFEEFPEETLFAKRVSPGPPLQKLLSFVMSRGQPGSLAKRSLAGGKLRHMVPMKL